MMQAFHFLRPGWLLTLLPLFVFAWLLWRRPRLGRSWKAVIDPLLLPHLLVGETGKWSRWPVLLFLTAGILGIVALAGPTWSKLPQPVYKQEAGLVIALDLSRSMDAGDIRPSRLARARHKISDILNQRKEGQVGLIVYASQAFTVSPLTDDAGTINALLPSLNTGIMPAQGSRADTALTRATELLENAGIRSGDILLVTDGIDASSKDAFKKTRALGHRVSVFAIGTEDGAPIALGDGGFLKDAQGSIVVPKLNRRALRSAATQAGGRFSELTVDDADIKHLLAPYKTSGLNAESTETELKTDVWREQGPWLVLLLIPLAALAFRRGYLALFVVLITPWSQPADALSWDELWSNSNQRAIKQLDQGDAGRAAQLFTDPEWKAAARYRAGQYEQAAEQLQQIDTAEAHYNRGNALAKLGKTGEAIDAYRRAIELNGDHEDAKYNKDLLEQQQKQEQEQEQQQQQSDGEQSKEGESDDSQEESSSDQQQAGDGQQQQNENADPRDARSPSDTEQTEDQQQQAHPAEKPDPDSEQTAPQPAMTEQQEEQLSQQATEQWLRRIPDDPGGLLRRKFRYQYQRDNRQRDEENPW